MALQNAKYMVGAVASGGNQKSGNAWSQIDQLLTCAICLDRYRNPKLLPCQHTFCMEPCIEGLIDYVRRQIKCPECRAEHRIPYQGIQGYPTNVTLMRFLELHFEVTGEIPDPTPSMMERCGVCSEKAYVTPCAHCEKKICTECKDAHMDIMKREISRINNQVKRGLNRLQDALCQATKSSELLQINATSVSQEIEETYRRLVKALKEREEALKLETNLFLQNELKSAENLKENLESEVNNIQSNCDLVDQHVTETDEWEDVELLEYKDILLKTLEFLRNYDTDQADFNRRLKFQLGPDSESVHQTIANAGELIVNAPNFPGSCVTNTLAVSSSAVLSRSKSDHRLAQSLSSGQLQQRHHEGYLSYAHRGAGGQGSDNESREGRSSPLTRRRTGELADGNRFRGRELEDERSLYSSRRSQGKDYGETRSWQRDETEHSSGFRSRFARERDEEDGVSKSVRFSRHQEANNEPPLPREKVFDTDDVTKGPISGITKLMDSAKVMERLQQQAQAKIKKEAMKQQQPVVTAPTQTASLPQRPVTNRQISEDDEVAKQKAQNKATAAQTSQTVTATVVQEPPTRQQVSRTSSAQRQDSTAKGQSKPTETRDAYHSAVEETASTDNRRRLTTRNSDTSLQRPTNEVSTTAETQSQQRKRAQTSAVEESIKPAVVTSKNEPPPKADADDDDDDDSDSESESEESDEPSPNNNDVTGKQNVLEDLTGQEKPNYFSQDETGRSGAPSPTSPKTIPFLSKTKPAVATDKDKKDSSETSSTSSESSGHRNVAQSTKDDKNSSLTGNLSKNANVTKSNILNTQEKSDNSHNLTSSGKTYSVDKNESQTPTKPRFVSRFLPRSSSLNQENKPDSSDSDSDDDTKTNSRNPREESSSINALLARSAMARKEPTTTSLNRSTYGRSNDDSSVGSWRSSAAAGNSYLHSRDDFKKDADGRSDTHEGRYSSLANKYLNRSRPSLHDDDHDTSITSKYGTGGSNYANRYLSKSKSSAVLTSSFDKDDADDQSGSARRSSLVGRDSSGSASSSKEKYRDRDSPSSTRFGGRKSSARTGHLGRSKSSHEIALEDEEDDDDDLGTTYSPRFERPSDYTSTRRRSHHSREQSPDETSSGATASGGLSSWARYLKSKYGNKGKSDAGKDNGNYQSVGRSRSSHALNSREASSESSDDECGIGSKVQPNSATKDSYSSGYRGMTSSRSNSTDSNQVDRRATSGYENPRSTYQHKQRAVMKIGSRGSEPGAFTWPRGIAVGPDSSIVVADSSNHRVQVFNSQGTFFKEFGTYGSGEGEFDCLAGVAVNRIGQYIISDRYNHRIQVFDPSGRFLRCFGSQGTSDGKLNCPWGVATDSLGFIYVCDKENHRIQVFQSDGTFVGKFGSLGNKPGQLEHPHYIAVSSTNKVIISDSNNHRIQIFDVNGRVLSSFGSEGTDHGQFKFPRGVAVDDQGYIIVGDSGNNRIQVFQSDGTFIKSFGAWGSGDSEFKGLEGVSVMQDGRILVCDRENHRVQIF
ncbi:hypothetical protein CHUAL_010903 [Chamberlinius hualienensis]